MYYPAAKSVHVVNNIENMYLWWSPLHPITSWEHKSTGWYWIKSYQDWKQFSDIVVSIHTPSQCRRYSHPQMHHKTWPNSYVQIRPSTFSPLSSHLQLLLLKSSAIWKSVNRNKHHKAKITMWDRKEKKLKSYINSCWYMS